MNVRDKIITDLKEEHARQVRDIVQSEFTITTSTSLWKGETVVRVLVNLLGSMKH